MRGHKMPPNIALPTVLLEGMGGRQLSEHQIESWRAASAAGLQGKGLLFRRRRYQVGDGILRPNVTKASVHHPLWMVIVYRTGLPSNVTSIGYSMDPIRPISIHYGFQRA